MLVAGLRAVGCCGDVTGHYAVGGHRLVSGRAVHAVAVLTAGGVTTAVERNLYGLTSVFAATTLWYAEEIALLASCRAV